MINFSNDLSNLPETCNDANLCFDVSNSSSQIRKVYAYLIDSGLKDSNNSEQSLYNLYIVSEVPIFAPTDCSFMLSNFNNLEVLNFNNNFNTSLTTSMKAMFQPIKTPSVIERSSHTESRIMLLASEEDESISFGFGLENKIIKLDLSNFNTSKVTNMSNMFGVCPSLISLDLSNFNTSKVTNMSNMFFECSSLTSLDLSGFNTSKVTNMYRMFEGCSSLISLDLSNFNTSNVTSMESMFEGCSSLTSIGLNKFNTSKVTDMSRMFFECSSLTSLDLSGFNTSKVTNMKEMFVNCSSLTSLDLSNFNTSKVTKMDAMFQYCSSLTNLDLSSFNTSNVTDMSFMFQSCSKLQTQINIMNTGTTSYSNMFSNAASDPSAHIIIGYTTNTQSIAEAMRNTCTDATAKARIELKKID